ncbi:MAG: DoxX family protein [Alphaproteobacteria bacterium]|nr:DoxX family protein [Alphaproteobacteria bacterium]MBV9965057.1 DoxX family protein [Alphaproteobacteria bacterium]
MNPNPFSDVLAFVTTPVWTTAVFWLLVLASVVIAVTVWIRLPEQRTFSNLVQWSIRLVMGAFWWQQTLWKLPPYYTDHPESAFGETGLAYWMGLMGKHAAIPLQADFVNNIVLPHFYLFAPAVYSLELLTGVSLMLGGLVRLFAIIGALQILNLWLGLYSAPGEWPWTYFFLFLLQVMFAIHCYGRALGIDAILTAEGARRSATGIMSRLFAAAG